MAATAEAAAATITTTRQQIRQGIRESTEMIEWLLNGKYQYNQAMLRHNEPVQHSNYCTLFLDFVNYLQYEQSHDELMIINGYICIYMCIYTYIHIYIYIYIYIYIDSMTPF